MKKVVKAILCVILAGALVGAAALSWVVYQEAHAGDELKKCDVIIVDECQFLTEKQVDELGDVALFYDVPVLCFGLATDFTTKLFEGSKRLFEIAESITEIKSICRCGSKATVNARLDENGRVLNKGEQFCLGGNDRYQAMCRRCWLEKLKEQGDIQRKEFEHEIEP